MAIAVVGTSQATAGTNNPVSLTLPSAEGNLQVVYLGGRTSSNAPSISGDGWTLVLIETLIGSTSARRQIAMWWRVVPASQSGTVTVSWSANTSRAAVGYELTTDTVGGAWSKDAHDDTDNGSTGTTSLASGSASPVNAEAATIYALVRRYGETPDPSYTNSFVAGPAQNSGNGSNHCTVAAGHKLASGTQATTVSWDTSATATGIIVAFSVAGAGGGDVELTVADTTHTHTTGSPPLAQTHSLTVADTAHGHTAVAGSMAQDHALTVAAGSHDHTADAPVLVVLAALELAGASHGHVADTVTLTVAGALAPADATHTHMADSAAFTQSHALAVSGAVHAHVAEPPSLEKISTGIEPAGLIVAAITGPARATGPTPDGPDVVRIVTGTTARRTTTGPGIHIETITGPARVAIPTPDGPTQIREVDGPGTARTLTGAEN